MGAEEFEVVWDIARDASDNVYIVGHTEGDLEGADAWLGGKDLFVTKYSASGEHQWTRQRGTDGFDAAYSVEVDSEGGVWTAGTWGREGAFVAKWDADGNERWRHTVGRSGDSFYALVMDAAGNVYAAGSVGGMIDGGMASGGSDPFIARIRDDGEAATRTWSVYHGTPERDVVRAMAAAPDGSLWVTGYTFGAFPGYVLGGPDDVFLLHVSPP